MGEILANTSLYSNKVTAFMFKTLKQTLSCILMGFCLIIVLIPGLARFDASEDLIVGIFQQTIATDLMPHSDETSQQMETNIKIAAGVLAYLLPLLICIISLYRKVLLPFRILKAFALPLLFLMSCSSGPQNLETETDSSPSKNKTEKKIIGNKKKVGKQKKKTSKEEVTKSRSKSKGFDGCGFDDFADMDFAYSGAFTSEEIAINGNRSGVDFSMTFRTHHNVVFSMAKGLINKIDHEAISTEPAIIADEFDQIIADAASDRTANFARPSKNKDVYFNKNAPLCVLLFGHKTKSEGLHAFDLQSETPIPTFINFKASPDRVAQELAKAKVFKSDINVDKSNVEGLVAGETFSMETTVSLVDSTIEIEDFEINADYGIRIENVYDHGPIKFSDGEELFEVETLDNSITYYVFESEIIAITLVTNDGKNREIKLLSGEIR